MGGRIPCNVYGAMDAFQAQLAEIDENYVRANLTPAEEAAHRRQRIAGGQRRKFFYAPQGGRAEG